MTKTGPIFSLPNIAEQYLDVLSSQQRYSSHTISNYKRDFTIFFSYISQQPSSFLSLSKKESRAFLSFLQKKKYHPRSISRMISALRSLWKFGIKVGTFQHNPWALLHLPKPVHPLPKLTDTQTLQNILSAMPMTSPQEYRNQLLCELLFASGLRVSEVSGLNISDVQLQQYELLVRGKGKKERIALFSPHVQSLLTYYLEHIRPLWVKTPNTKALFLSQKGMRISTRSIQRIVHALSKQYQIPLTPHLFRHGFASSLLNGGADLRSIQELLGHESLQSTQIYTHICEKQLKSIFNQAHPRA